MFIGKPFLLATICGASQTVSLRKQTSKADVACSVLDTQGLKCFASNYKVGHLRLRPAYYLPIVNTTGECSVERATSIGCCTTDAGWLQTSVPAGIIAIAANIRQAKL